jgi:hypothetical protein
MLSWMGYLLAGMAIGRLTLTARRTQVLLAVVGVATLVVLEGVKIASGGALHTDSSEWLSTVAHTYSPVEMVGNLASACVVIGVCLWLGQVARTVMWPLIAAGSLALTLYVGHIMVIAAVGDDIVYESSNVSYAALCLASIAFACVWRWLVGQGPLEAMMSVASMKAAEAVTGQGEPASRVSS